MTVIIDYGLGNLGAIANLLRKIGAASTISSSQEVIAGADRLILPGVGAFEAGMNNLIARELVPVLRRKVLEEHTPILGICLGLQLFGTGSDEGRQPGLGWLDARSIRFKPAPDGPGRVPHMGWNTIRVAATSPLLDGLGEDSRFYFAHSYHLECRERSAVAGVTKYGYDFPSIIAQGNVLGTQFHPEKSHRFGVRLMKNFVQMSRC